MIYAISLDYDGCGDALFNYKPKMQEYKHNLQEFFLDFLHKAENNETVYLLCGSNRQSHYFDKEIDESRDNGLALVNLPEWAKERKLVYIDCRLCDRHDRVVYNGRVVNLESLDHSSFRRSLKAAIVKNQLAYLSRKHPAEDIGYYFVDDNHHHLHSIKKACQDIPERCHVVLTQFSWRRKIYGKYWDSRESAQQKLMQQPALQLERPYSETSAIQSQREEKEIAVKESPVLQTVMPASRIQNFAACPEFFAVSPINCRAVNENSETGATHSDLPATLQVQAVVDRKVVDSPPAVLPQKTVKKSGFFSAGLFCCGVQTASSSGDGEKANQQKKYSGVR